MYIAHEFFDALPAHQFVKTERGWCERLVDIAGPDSAQHLRLVLSPGATPATSLLLKKRLETISSEQRESALMIKLRHGSHTPGCSFSHRSKPYAEASKHST